MRIAVTTGKGGTGKTTTAMALSSALAGAGKVCLLIDLDPQANSTIGLGVAVQDGDLTVRDLFTEGTAASLDRLVRETAVHRLHIVPSNGLLKVTAEYLMGRKRREYILDEALKRSTMKFDFVVMDCPHWLGVLTDNAIAAADFIIVPCQMEARARDGLVDVLEVVSFLKGEKFDRWGILLIKVDSRKTLTNEAVMLTLKEWEGKIFKTTVPVSEPLNQAQIARQDIFIYDPRSSGALAYQAFSKEILKYGRQKESSASRGSRRRDPEAAAGQAP